MYDDLYVYMKVEMESCVKEEGNHVEIGAHMCTMTLCIQQKL